MGAYLPLIVWLASAVVCQLIARRRNVEESSARRLFVVIFGPFAIPFIFLFKPRDLVNPRDAD